MQNNGDRISSCVYIKGTHNKKKAKPSECVPN